MVPVVPVMRSRGVRAVPVTTSMWLGAPVNNLMVRSQLACSFQGPGIAGSRRGPMGWPRFHGFSMIAKTFCALYRGQNHS